MLTIPPNELQCDSAPVLICYGLILLGLGALLLLRSIK
jgi:hypothetical protein